MQNTVFLASQSASRQRLLKEAEIPFKIVGHQSNESVCNWQRSFSDILKSIASEKMNQVLLPEGVENEYCFVLTADTMGKDSNGIIHGKPRDKKEAIKQIKALNGFGLVGTAFCLEKKCWNYDHWVVEKRIIECVETAYEFYMPDACIERYLTATPYYHTLSGSLTIQNFGAQFLKSIHGSYTSIIGLPMFELRVALEEIGFYV